MNRPALALARPTVWRSYLVLTKPRVVALISFTAIVGTLLASPGWPPIDALLWGNCGITLAAACAATLNHLFDQHIDQRMARTRGRPLPRGELTPSQALRFAVVLGITAMVILVSRVNVLTAVLTFASLVGYSVIYTLWLKRATSQNIVIGGGGVPMLPVTHGIEYTQNRVLVYTAALSLVTLIPFFTRMSGPLYLASALLLDGLFLYHAVMLKLYARPGEPMRVFKYSVAYLMWLFGALLTDHYLPSTQFVSF
jgi:protoheme IX farnesyltransferase